MLTPAKLRTWAHTGALVTGAAIVTLLASGLLIGTPGAWEWRALTLFALWPVFVVAVCTSAACNAFQSVGDAYQAGIETGRQQGRVVPFNGAR